MFHGTRGPVVALFENLKDGVSINKFVELFPGIGLIHARSVLEHADKKCNGSSVDLKVLFDQVTPFPLRNPVSSAQFC